MSDLPATNRTMLTEVKPEGVLELYLAELPMPTPRDHEVVVKVQATPINPSDLGLMVGAADVTSARAIDRDGLPGVAMQVPEAGMRFMAGRVGQALPIGNEGCGVVVAAGAAPEAQALMGKTVALIGGEIYAQYRCLAAQMCLPLPDGTAPEDGASCFVNPLTSLGFVETMKLEGYKAIVHAAAASNLGQMLVKICKADGIPLVNIVRSQAQVDLLKGIGAEIVLNSTDEDFVEQLTSAIEKTEAFLGFDPIGGGKLAGQILGAMEAAAVRRMAAYSRYG
ncbi:MAG: NADH oxidase [Sphingorhabdus sp.]|nr:NADH oxidase [Sphingorhabdus sp.]